MGVGSDVTSLPVTTPSQGLRLSAQPHMVLKPEALAA